MLDMITTDDKIICKFTGRMDAVASMRCENDVEIRIQQAKKPVVFDLELVDYVSSAFIRLCIAAIKKSGAENFSIINACEPVRKVFNISGLENFLKAAPAPGQLQ